MRPESLMMGYGYRPEWSEGALKPPVFQTSTFVFASAEEGKEFFARAYGLDDKEYTTPMGLIYSRVNNPDLDILESRLVLWDGAEASATFASGMAAISTTLLTLVRPGDGVIFSRPVYGGTDTLLENLLPEMGITTREIPAGASPDTAAAICRELEEAGSRCRMIFLETPSNPTNVLSDIVGMSEVAHRHGALCAVDNTLLGPIYQQPLTLGADLVIYSATKYLGGHSDVVAGVTMGSRELVDLIKSYRTILGTTLDPHSAWLLLRSLETAKLRITCARKNAEKVAQWLAAHPKISCVHYPGLSDDPDQKRIFDQQCSGPGSLLSFEIRDGGEREAFQMLNQVRLIKLAVSLGGTESLIQHPATMTHANVPLEDKLTFGVLPGLIRLSVGIEHPEDLIEDLRRALDAVEIPTSVPTLTLASH
jgi:methionine-gamma-lyase